MINFINKLFTKNQNLDSINLSFKKLSKEVGVNQVFKTLNEFSEQSEVRYVGGCVRKIINNEIVDDIDLAVNLNPHDVCEALNQNGIKFYETGIKHGTITAIIGNNTFEITSLRKDIKTDGRHAKVEFTTDWLHDASRRDFTINSIYADINGNLFDPFNGKKSLEKGEVKFIGEEDKRIKEDYLRILRYVRFFLNYSKQIHDINVINKIKQNLDGISKLSPERLIEEFKKLVKSDGIIELINDKFCLEIIILIFPQFKNFNILKNQSKQNIHKLDIFILISLLIIDKSDNAEYFLFKFKISKKDENRILFLKNFFSQKITKKTFTKNNLWKILYINGNQALMDLLDYQIFKSKKNFQELLEIKQFFINKEPPLLPVKGSNLMDTYNIPEGKKLGATLKRIEKKWIDNNFKITENEIKKEISN